MDQSETSKGENKDQLKPISKDELYTIFEKYRSKVSEL